MDKQKLVDTLRNGIGRLNSVVNMIEKDSNQTDAVITDNVEATINSLFRQANAALYFGNAQLGYATTGELLDELKARAEIDGKLNYTTVEGGD